MTDDERNIADPSRLGARLGAETDQEAGEFEDVAARLALAAEPVEPPAELKTALFAKLGSLPQLPAEAPQSGAAPVPPPAEQAQAEPTPTERRAQRRWFQRPGAILAAAAAAVILFVGGVFVGSTIAGTSSYQQQQASALAAINASPDAQRASAGISGGGTATLVWSAQLGRSALVATDLPPLPNDKTYELWYIRSGTATPAGTMNADGSLATWRVLAGEMKAGDTVGMTVEPSGGSKQPTTKPIVAISS